jgi:hypothetical protein
MPVITRRIPANVATRVSFWILTDAVTGRLLSNVGIGRGGRRRSLLVPPAEDLARSVVESPLHLEQRLCRVLVEVGALREVPA